MAACSVVSPASNLCKHGRLYKGPNLPPPHAKLVLPNIKTKCSLNWVTSLRSRRGTYGPPRAGLSNESQSPSSVIKQLYSSINDRNLKHLSSFIADDCFFEDTTFSKPFKGKKEVVRFLSTLTEAMGKSLMFVVDDAYEGPALAGVVTWHLEEFVEWKEHAIPIARGCGFYHCSRNGSGLVVMKARVLVESPLKPGELALKLLKIISSLLDRFPHQAKSFLLNYPAVIQFLQKIYKYFVEPFIIPLLVNYSNLWKYVVNALTFLLNILLKILSIFN